MNATNATSNPKEANLLLDSDGSNLFMDHPDSWESAEQFVRETVEECAPEVDTYLLCSNAGQCYFPTDVSVMRSESRKLAQALNEPDLFGALLRGIKASGRRTLITMRMNDVHKPTDDSYQNIPPIRRDHPELIVAPDEAEADTGGWMAYCLDYTRAPVQEFELELFQELVARYGGIIDGIQLDWMRFPRHLPGESPWEHRDALTDFIAHARDIVDGSENGLELGVRVPPTPEGCRATGMDLPAWAQRGLVDWMTLCPFLTTNWGIPFTAFREWMNGHAPPLYGGFDFAFGKDYHHPESLRGVSASLCDLGADGIYLFNFPCWIEYLAARPYHWLSGVEKPSNPMLLSVDHAFYRRECDGPAVLPDTIDGGDNVEIPIHVPKAALPMQRGHLLVQSSGAVDVSLHNEPLRRIHYRKRGSAGEYEGRAGIFLQYHHPERFDDHRPSADDCYNYRVPARALKAGRNVFTIDNQTDENIDIERLHLGIW